MKHLSLLLASAFAASAVQAAPVIRPRPGQPTFQSFAPPNTLHLRDRVERIANIDEALFNQIIDDAVKIFAPIVAAHGATLEVSKNWSDGTVNAYAMQSGSKWQVAMFGGLARRPEVTPDGFALVVCHELGHHLGGYVFSGARWASAEGQSDYYATQACGRILWGKEFARNRLARREVDPVAKTACDKAWQSPAERELCYRLADGGMSLAHLLATLGGQPKPKFETPDPTVVTTTVTSHPKGQCRLDTYFQGALCTKKFDNKKIPAKNHPKGQGSAEAELEAMESSCFAKAGFEVGNRPSCWFKALNN